MTQTIATIETQLTPRQNDIARLIAHRGMSNQAIADYLDLSICTVKVHLSSVFEKYRVKNRAQLVLAYNNNGRLPTFN